MRVNRLNLEAVNLLSEGRNFEATGLLQQALSLDPQDPFTLNNLGAADEANRRPWRRDEVLHRCRPSSLF